MSARGDLLELVDRGGLDVRAVRATIRTWRHHARAVEAQRAHAERVGAAFGTYGPGVHEEESEHVVRLWLAPPDRAREERDEGHVSVRDGARWWTYHPTAGVMSNEADPSVRMSVGDTHSLLFAPGALLAGNLLEAEYTEAKVGRRVEVVFEKLNDDITLPQFLLARTTPA